MTHSYQSNLVNVLPVLSLFFCNFISTTAYHLGRFKPLGISLSLLKSSLPDLCWTCDSVQHIERFIFEYQDLYFTIFCTKSFEWAVVVAQLVERLLPSPEVRGLNPIISKTIIECMLSTVYRKDKTKEKRPGMAHFLTFNFKFKWNQPLRENSSKFIYLIQVVFFKKMGHPGLFFFIFVFSIHSWQ